VHIGPITQTINQPPIPACQGRRILHQIRMSGFMAGPVIVPLATMAGRL
jgi:hypothetical protein